MSGIPADDGPVISRTDYQSRRNRTIVDYEPDFAGIDLDYDDWLIGLNAGYTAYIFAVVVHREELRKRLPDLVKRAKSRKKIKDSGQGNMFDYFDDM